MTELSVIHHLLTDCTCTSQVSAIESTPPLFAKRRPAIEEGHICFMTKIHAEVKGSGLASWAGAAYPNNLLCGFGDGVTPSGNIYVVAFGSDERPHFAPGRDPEKILVAF